MVNPNPPFHGMWRKSTLSEASECVEIAFAHSAVLVRNSRDPSGPVLTFTPEEWTAFLDGVRNREFDPV